MADSASLLLYVEDEVLISMAVSLALEDAGFNVEHVVDGSAAISALGDRAAEFRALVTDVRLPEVDGWEIAHHARALSPSIPVVYVSGDSAVDWSAKVFPTAAGAEAIRQCTTRGCNHDLAEPNT